MWTKLLKSLSLLFITRCKREFPSLKCVYLILYKENM